MSDSTIELKSTKYVLTIVMDGGAPYEKVLSDIKDKFRKSARFFKGASMALEFSGRELSDSQKKEIVSAIRAACGLDVACLVEHDEREESAQFQAISLAALDEEPSQINDGISPEGHESADIYYGSVKNGRKLVSDKTIILLGDIEPGGEVISDRSIFVAGCVMGSMKCGLIPGEGAFAGALVLKPSSLEISGHKSVSAIRKRTMDDSYKPYPQVCTVSDGHMKTETISGRTWSHIFEKLTSGEGSEPANGPAVNGTGAETAEDTGREES